MNKPVIAVVGYSRSGKGQVAKMLEGKGFASFSGGDYLRTIAIERGQSTERWNLIILANELRAKNGSDFLMQAVTEISIEVEQNPGRRGLVVDSIRNPGEVIFLQENLGALVVNVWAPDEQRWARTKADPKEGDPENWYEFIGLNAIDRGFGQAESGQNIAGCVELADITLYNDSSTLILERELDTVLMARGIIEGGRRTERF